MFGLGTPAGYSLRSTVMGSRRTARRAGKCAAAKVRAVIVNRLATMAAGSAGLTW